MVDLNVQRTMITGAASGGGANGFIGTDGTPTVGWSFGGTMIFTYFTNTTPGTVSYIHVHIYNVAITSYINCGIYAPNTDVKLADGTKQLSTSADPHWQTITLDSPVILEEGKGYTLVYATDDLDSEIGYIVAADLYKDDQVIGNLSTLPNGIEDWTMHKSGISLSIYADNTP